MRKQKAKRAVVALSIALAIILGGAVSVFATVSNVGGGTWNHGLYSLPRGVWSNYVHNGKYHSATSICDATNNKVFKNAGYWANTSAYGSGTRHAYWNTY